MQGHASSRHLPEMGLSGPGAESFGPPVGLVMLPLGRFLELTNVTVRGGLFVLALDFGGGLFPGEARRLAFTVCTTNARCLMWRSRRAVRHHISTCPNPATRVAIATAFPKITILSFPFKRRSG